MARLGAGEIAKYHALGNAYLVVDADSFGRPLTAADVRGLCDVRRGIGSDGLLALSAATGVAARLAIYNPDGSRAERSGNGLRICARALVELGYAAAPALRIATDAGTVTAQVDAAPAAADWQVSVAMGTPSFDSRDVGVAGAPRPLLDMALEVSGAALRCDAVSVGNPHCVVWDQPLTAARLTQLGPPIEGHPAFLRRTNVQLARVRDRGAVELLIWERGAGATSASGSSACAVVAAAHRRGWVDARVVAHMPGGILTVTVDDAGGLTLAGPVTAVLRGHMQGRPTLRDAG